MQQSGSSHDSRLNKTLQITSYIVLSTLYDTFWASGLHILDNSHKDRAYWRGANVLGSVLMEARDIIRTELSECTV